MVNWGGIFGRRGRPKRPGPASGDIPQDDGMPKIAPDPVDKTWSSSGDALENGEMSRITPDPVNDTGSFSGELRKLQAEAHDSLGMVRIKEQSVPVIYFDGARFADLERWNLESAGERGTTTIMTDLNILRDFMGNVFVEVVLRFDNGKTLKVLINANRYLVFFKALAASGMLSLTADGSVNYITIQLPQPYKAEEALGLIEKGLEPPDRK